MRTTQSIADEINELLLEAAEIKAKLKSDAKRLASDVKSLKKRIGAITKKVVFLKMCKQYLDTQPDREFLVKEEKRLKTRLSLIDKEFHNKYPDGKFTKEAKSSFYKLMLASHTKTHLKNIRYLLN